MRQNPTSPTPQTLSKSDRQLRGPGAPSLTLAHTVGNTIVSKCPSPLVSLSAGEGSTGVCHTVRVKLSVCGEESCSEFRAEALETYTETGFWCFGGRNGGAVPWTRYDFSSSGPLLFSFQSCPFGAKAMVK